MAVEILEFWLLFGPDKNFLENHPTFNTFRHLWPWWGVRVVEKIVKPHFCIGQGNVCWVWWGYGRHDICQKVYTTGVFGAKILPKKRVNRDNGKFTTKQRKFFKLLNLRQNSVMLQYNILANIQLSQETLGQSKISQDE